ncbi:hypothetical protein K503DRAFT_428358 [Rhizopogon vinicolor AM-OR11-026]|uniref:Uncharacterized protein n=1 Tax=Rhizopogon vinicolor AM-OR11-026 TaxID=1314800 RepID=A0A1B7MQ22_9AGAM|nr:hypothetical protein K503DRAFT_428358 [Rhizopogon vinicolor AM-OR11-026]
MASSLSPPLFAFLALIFLFLFLLARSPPSNPFSMRGASVARWMPELLTTSIYHPSSPLPKIRSNSRMFLLKMKETVESHSGYSIDDDAVTVPASLGRRSYYSYILQ